MADRGDTSGAQNRGERLVIIANPRGGGGRAGAARAAIEAAAARAFAQVEIRWTERPGHATELARVAAHEADIVAALGGDGTCSEVVNGLVPAGVPVNPKVVFAVIPFGTGGDLVRSLEVPKSLDRSLWVAATGTTLPLDVGLARWADGRTRTFVNVCGVGANADVCVRANASSKRFGGTLTFFGALIGSLRAFEPQRVRWEWEGPEGPGALELDTFAAFCANGHFCGGGMHVGKGGSMADGTFELTLVPRPTARLVRRLLPVLYNGGLVDSPEVVHRRVTRVRVDGALPMEGDGEPIGQTPVDLEVVPRALQVRGGWLRPPGAAG